MKENTNKKADINMETNKGRRADINKEVHIKRKADRRKKVAENTKINSSQQKHIIAEKDTDVDMSVKQKIHTAACLAAFFALMFLAGSGVGYAVQRASNVMTTRVLAVENWGLGFGQEGTQPSGNTSAAELKKYDAYYIGDASEKVIYLTFDCGYENGNTEPILDALKKHNVKATFFVVGHYLESAPELVKRMVEEGHTVGNHTYHHPDMSKISGMEQFKKEMGDVEKLFETTTGQPISMYYRPPQGKYSVENLKMAQELGYKTFFWSLAYVDWNQDSQPTHEEAFSKLTGRIHPGAVVLLHNTSRTNGEILDELLTKWEEMGYTFGILEDL